MKVKFFDTREYFQTRDSPSVGGCPRVPARPTSHSPPGTLGQGFRHSRTREQQEIHLNTKSDKSKINNNNHNMSFLFVLHFVYIWGWNKSKPEFLYLAQFLWHFLKVSISSRGELWRGKYCKGWVTTGARRSLLRSFSFSRNAKIVAGLSTRPLTAESFGQRLAESISWEGGVMQELMQAGRRSTGRSHLDTPDHLSAGHSNLQSITFCGIMKWA